MVDTSHPSARPRPSAATRRSARAAVISMLILLPPPAGSANTDGADDARQQVLDSWRGRQESIRSIKMSLKGIERIPAGVLSPRLNTPPHDVEMPVGAVLYIDFENGRIRVDLDQFIYREEGDPLPRSTQSCFDGTSATTYKPPESNNRDDNNRHVDVVLLGNEPQPEVFMARDHVPAFWSVGVFLEEQLSSRGFREPFAPDDWEVVEHHHHAGQEVRDRNLVSLRHLPTDSANPKSTVVWTVDPQRDGAVVEYESAVREEYRSRVFGATSTRIDVRDYRQYELGWFPTGWEMVQASGDFVHAHYAYEVSDIEFNLDWPVEFFSLPDAAVQPDAIVASDGKVRKVSRDGQTLGPLDGSAASTDVLTLRRSQRLWVVLAINVLFLTALAVAIRQRGRRRKKDVPE